MAGELSDELRAALKLVHEAGYLVAKIPECKRGTDHGRHTLIVRSAMCEGKGVIPHGYRSAHVGLFGMWVSCACGHDFADYGPKGEPTDWIKHKLEHGVSS